MLKVQKPSDWEVKITIAGLFTILAILVYLLTQYCPECNSIHRSIYGKPFGIPLAVYGISFIILLLYLFFEKNRWFYPALCLSLVVSLVLVTIQALVLRQYCIYCLACEGLFFMLWVINKYNRKKLIWAILIALCMGLCFILGWLMNAVADDSMHYISPEGEITQKFAVYTWEGTQTQIELTDKKTIFVASWCDHCHELLKSLSFEDWEQIYVVDVAIEDIKTEKAYFNELNIKKDHFFFDLDNNLSVDSLPYIYPGKE